MTTLLAAIERLEVERDQLIAEREDSWRGLEEGRWARPRDVILVGAGVQQLNEQIDELEAVITRWKPVALNEQQRPPRLFPRPDSHPDSEEIAAAQP